MKKITKVVAMLLAVVMVFTGCASVEQTTVINSNGSARVTFVLDLQKSQTDAVIKKMGYTNPEAYIKSYLNYEDGGYYEIVTIDGEQYYEYRDVQGIRAKNLTEDLNDALSVSKKGLYITKDTVYGLVDDFDEEFQEGLDELKALGYNANSLKMKLAFEFPAKVVSVSKAGKIDKTNSKKVTFTIDIGKKTTIFATTNKANTYSSIKKKVDKSNTIKKPTIKSLKVKSIKKKKGTVTLKLKKMSGANYVIECSTSKKFPYEKTTYKYTKKPTVTLKNLKAGKKYYVRVQAYKYNYAGKYIVSKTTTKSIKIVKKSKKK